MIADARVDPGTRLFCRSECQDRVGRRLELIDKEVLARVRQHHEPRTFGIARADASVSSGKLVICAVEMTNVGSPDLLQAVAAPVQARITDLRSRSASK